MAPKKISKRNGEFEVERIVSDKYEGGKRFFFIKWKDFSAYENTWEPEENLSNCSRLIREYFNSKGLRNSKSHSLSTTLLRSLKVSKQRRSSISSLIAISSLKSSRRLVVCLERIDADTITTIQNNDKFSANGHQGKSQTDSLLNTNAPNVKFIRINDDYSVSLAQRNTQSDSNRPAETLSVDLVKIDEHEMKSSQHTEESRVNFYSPKNIQLTDYSTANRYSPMCSELTVTLPRISPLMSHYLKHTHSATTKEEVSISPDISYSNSYGDNELHQVFSSHADLSRTSSPVTSVYLKHTNDDIAEESFAPLDTDNSNSHENNELHQYSSSDADETLESSIHVNSSTDSTCHHSPSTEFKPNATITVRLFDKISRPELLSSVPILDDIEDSDEEFLTFNVFEEGSDEENGFRWGRKKRRGNRK